MRVIGLTGGIASGKSTVARMFEARGIPVVDADLLARAVVAPGSEALEEIVSSFGPQMRTADGALDRDALGRLVFADAEARTRLNAIVHPRVQAASAAELQKHAQASTPLLLMDIPLLYEARDPATFAAVVVVYVDAARQRERLMARNGLTEAEAQARIAAQMPIEEKRARADYVIDNRGSLEETEAQVALLTARFMNEE